MADPQALVVAVAAAHALEFVGLPEAQLNLSQAADPPRDGAEEQRQRDRHLERRADIAAGALGEVPAAPPRRPLPQAPSRSATAPATSTPHDHETVAGSTSSTCPPSSPTARGTGRRRPGTSRRSARRCGGGRARGRVPYAERDAPGSCGSSAGSSPVPPAPATPSARWRRPPTLRPSNVAQSASAALRTPGPARRRRRAGRACRAARRRERELRAERDGRLVRLGDHLARRRRGARRRQAGRVRPGHPDAAPRPRPRGDDRPARSSTNCGGRSAPTACATGRPSCRSTATTPAHGGRGGASSASPSVTDEVAGLRARRRRGTASRSSPAARAPAWPAAPCRPTAPSSSRRRR